jgi:hypothetical protein
LIGSVACPLQREVPRSASYRQSHPHIAHECKDVDLALWVSRLGGLDDWGAANLPSIILDADP